LCAERQGACGDADAPAILEGVTRILRRILVLAVLLNAGFMTVTVASSVTKPPQHISASSVIRPPQSTIDSSVIKPPQSTTDSSVIKPEQM
jgi:hypothetical protein